MRVEFPWPHKSLSPNARTHWATRSRIVKKTRADAYALTKAAGPADLPDSGPIKVSIEFYPPTRRRQDLDNALSRAKSTLDGFAEALGIDDSRFEITMKMAGIGGKVVVNV